MKKAIATLCALAACSAAQAQSNVTIYGNLDEYVGYIHSDSGKSITGLNDGTSLRSRWGFKGMEDLGNGLQAKFQLESGFSADTGALGDSSRLFDRQAWVGIAGNFGEFRLGRQNSEIQQIGDWIDYTGRTTFGSIVNNFGVPSRYDNDLSFKTARMNGLQVSAHYALAEQLGGGIAQQAVVQLAADYLNGPFRVGYAGIAAKPAPTATVKNRVQYHNVYGNYDYGQGKVYLAYVRSNNISNPVPITSATIFTSTQILSNTGTPNTFAGTDGDARRFFNIYQISGDYRITPQFRVGALYGKIVDKGITQAGAKGGNVGGYYDLSKRTTLYAFASRMANDRDAGFRFQGSAGPSAQLTTAADINNHTLTGFQTGIIHRF